MNKEDMAHLKKMQDKVDKKIMELDSELRTLKLQNFRDRIRRFFLKVWMWMLGCNEN